MISLPSGLMNRATVRENETRKRKAEEVEEEPDYHVESDEEDGYNREVEHGLSEISTSFILGNVASDTSAQVKSWIFKYLSITKHQRHYPRLVPKNHQK